MKSSTVALVGMASTASLVCRNCARTTEFEQPPCPDGHESDCPEWYCTECGAATMVGQSERRWSRGNSRPSSGLHSKAGKAG